MSTAYKSGYLALCFVALVWFPDEDPLWIEICKNIEYDNVI
jgi:hypothetical protein